MNGRHLAKSSRVRMPALRPALVAQFGSGFGETLKPRWEQLLPVRV
jgi:hypothetical protein